MAMEFCLFAGSGVAHATRGMLCTCAEKETWGVHGVMKNVHTHVFMAPCVDPHTHTPSPTEL